MPHSYGCTRWWGCCFYTFLLRLMYVPHMPRRRCCHSAEAVPPCGVRDRWRPNHKVDAWHHSCQPPGRELICCVRRWVCEQAAWEVDVPGAVPAGSRVSRESSIVKGVSMLMQTEPGEFFRAPPFAPPSPSPPGGVPGGPHSLDHTHSPARHG